MQTYPSDLHGTATPGPAFSSGDSQAFRHIYSKYYSSLWYFANRLISNKEQAEDIVAEVFIRFWKQSGSFETQENIKAFLFIATKNACLDYLKHIRRKTASQKEISYLSATNEDFIQSNIIKAELLQLVVLEMENMPSQMKKIFGMIYIEGLDTAEVAKELNLSADNVRVQKSKALQQLRQAFLKRGWLGFSSAALFRLFMNC